MEGNIDIGKIRIEKTEFRVQSSKYMAIMLMRQLFVVKPTINGHTRAN